MHTRPSAREIVRGVADGAVLTALAVNDTLSQGARRGQFKIALGTRHKDRRIGLVQTATDFKIAQLPNFFEETIALSAKRVEMLLINAGDLLLTNMRRRGGQTARFVHSVRLCAQVPLPAVSARIRDASVSPHVLVERAVRVRAVKHSRALGAAQDDPRRRHALLDFGRRGNGALFAFIRATKRFDRVVGGVHGGDRSRAI